MVTVKKGSGRVTRAKTRQCCRAECDVTCNFASKQRVGFLQTTANQLFARSSPRKLVPNVVKRGMSVFALLFQRCYCALSAPQLPRKLVQPKSHLRRNERAMVRMERWVLCHVRRRHTNSQLYQPVAKTRRQGLHGCTHQAVHYAELPNPRQLDRLVAVWFTFWQW